MPFLSMNAGRAARQIVAAARRGQPALTITIPARCLIFAQAIMPNLLARILQLVNLLLPANEVGRGLVRQKGYDSLSAWAPSLLTILADQAAPLYNEGPPASLSNLG